MNVDHAEVSNNIDGATNTVQFRRTSQPITRRAESYESEYRKRVKLSKTKFVEGLLRPPNYGSCLLQEYENNNNLSDNSAQVLCDIIASALITSPDRYMFN